MDVFFDLAAIVVGVIIGGMGSLTGIGGGFLLMPILLLIFPAKSASSLATVSMTVVFFNALSGSIPAAIGHRIDWKVAMPYALATVPTVLIGLLAQAAVHGDTFKKVFGVFMVLSAIFLFWGQQFIKKPATSPVSVRWRYWVGLGLSPLFGFFSSFFGVGGGFLFVPLFAHLLGQSLRNATANSQLVLLVVSLTILVAGIGHYSFGFDTEFTVFLVLGVIGGAQIGHLLAARLHSKLIMALLVILTLVAGIRLIMS